MPASRRTFPRPAHGRSGYTLVELVVSLGISAVLVGGLASSVLIATKSLESPSSSSAATVEAGEAADQLAAELGTALTFTERTSTALTFTVPDRDGDQQAETIRYAWSGAGNPLTRQYNGSAATAAPLTGRLQGFNLQYLTKTILPPVRVSVQQNLAYYNGSNADLNISQSRWPAQYFQPSLPSNATAWSIITVRLYLKKVGLGQTLTIRISAANGSGKPTGTPLATASRSTSSISTTSFQWVDVSLSGLTGLSPSTGLVLQVTGSGSGTLAVTRCRLGSAPSSSIYCESTNQGSSWTNIPNSAMHFQVLGTVTTQ
ncbi:MAG: type II secretion system protein [Pirellulales bacterium]